MAWICRWTSAVTKRAWEGWNVRGGALGLGGAPPSAGECRRPAGPGGAYGAARAPAAPPAHPRAHNRHIVVQLRVARRSAEQCFVSDHVLGRHFASDVGGERHAVAIRAREELEPQIAHLVLRSLAPLDARGWLLRIA